MEPVISSSPMKCVNPPVGWMFLEGAPRLLAPDKLRRRLLQDATGDCLDAAICAMQAAWAWRRKRRRYGLPPEVDPLEGWILMAR